MKTQDKERSIIGTLVQILLLTRPPKRGKPRRDPPSAARGRWCSDQHTLAGWSFCFAIWLWSGEGCNRRLHAGPNWLGARGRRTSAANPLCSCAGRFRAASPRAHCCSACSAYGMIKVKGRGTVSASGQSETNARCQNPLAVTGISITCNTWPMPIVGKPSKR